MTNKERFLSAISFKNVDRLPMVDFGYWKETIDTWHLQGLPEYIQNDAQVEEFFGLDRGFEQNMVNGFNHEGERGIIFRIYPKFEKRIIEENNETITYYNEDGILLKATKTHQSMPQFIKYPVATMEDFERIVPRLNAKDPGRIKEDFYEIILKANISNEAIGVWLDGFFAWPRELMGIENLSIAYFEDPKLIHAINSQHACFIKEYIDVVLSKTKVDYACFFEDMAYKSGALISPRIFREFMTTYYEDVIQYLKGKGIQKIMIDSDGNTVELCQLFVEVGADVYYPCEINAGSHPEVLRKKYPNLALIGGIDKKALIAGKDSIDKELSKLPALIELGGYIPAVDHRIPPDVTLENYKYYVEKKKEIISRLF